MKQTIHFVSSDVNTCRNAMYRFDCYKDCMESPADRLKKLRLELGLEHTSDASRRFGWPEGTYRSHENGTRNVSRKAAEAYARGYKSSAVYILYGEGSPHPAKAKLKLVSGYDPDAPEPVQSDGFAEPEGALYEGNKVSSGTLFEHATYGGAGSGGYAMDVMVDGKHGEAILGTWTFPPSFLKNELHLNLSHSDIIRVRGDSMEPTLWDGDRVIIDRTDIDVRVDGIFAIADEGSVIIKQVEIVRGTDPLEIVCRSRNESYPSFKLKIGGNTRIIGRVVARIGRV